MANRVVGHFSDLANSKHAFKLRQPDFFRSGDLLAYLDFVLFWEPDATTLEQQNKETGNDKTSP